MPPSDPISPSTPPPVPPSVPDPTAAPAAAPAAPPAAPAPPAPIPAPPEVIKTEVMPTLSGATSTMGSTSGQPPKSKRTIYIIIGILVVILVGLVAWRLVQAHKPKAAAVAKPVTTAAQTTVSPTSGSDNQSLSNDLTTVSNGLTNENQAQSAATSAVNDQQQEVNVPAN